MVTKRPTTKKVAAKPRAPKKRASRDPTLWSDIAAMFASVPEKDWAAVPHNAARRFDELIEGSLLQL
jgi:hypothetical protein